jgi:Nif-specific regulatory protein
MESEFFGVAKGAFTGAVSKEGRFELADGGTIFLDEIGDIRASVQPKLLRVLEEGTFERVGDRATIRVDVRVISATSKDLDDMIRRGELRRELYHRLNTYPVELPPLRERLEDIPLLLVHFVQVLAREMGKPEPEISPEVPGALMDYDWSQNNVRELRNRIEAAMIRCQGEPLRLSDFRLASPGRSTRAAGRAFHDAKNECISKFENDYIEDILTTTRGNVTQAARRAGIARRTMQDLLRKHGIDPNGFKTD